MKFFSPQGIYSEKYCLTFTSIYFFLDQITQQTTRTFKKIMEICALDELF